MASAQGPLGRALPAALLCARHAMDIACDADVNASAESAHPCLLGLAVCTQQNAHAEQFPANGPDSSSVFAALLWPSNEAKLQQETLGSTQALWAQTAISGMLSKSPDSPMRSALLAGPAGSE